MLRNIIGLGLFNKMSLDIYGKIESVIIFTLWKRFHSEVDHDTRVYILHD